MGVNHTFCGGELVRRHVLELCGAILLCLAAYLGCSLGFRFSLPAIGMRSGVTSYPFEWTADRIELPAWHITYPTFPNFCLGLCTNEETLR
jgi:hypothetical protein